MRKIFNQTVKINITTYEHIRKITTDQRDDYTTTCLLDNFGHCCKMIAINLSKQQVLYSII